MGSDPHPDGVGVWWQKRTEAGWLVGWGLLMAEDTVLMGRGRVATSLGTLRSQLGVFAKATVSNCFLARAPHYPEIPSSPQPA